MHQNNIYLNNKTMRKKRIDPRMNHIYCPLCHQHMGEGPGAEDAIVAHLKNKQCSDPSPNEQVAVPNFTQEEKVTDKSVEEQVKNLLDSRETENENQVYKAEIQNLSNKIKHLESKITETDGQPKGHTDLTELAQCENCGPPAIKKLDKDGGAFILPGATKREYIDLAKAKIPEINQVYEL